MNRITELAEAAPEPESQRPLVRATCCNYDNGNCLFRTTGTKCVCADSFPIRFLCKWFRVAVLPADRLLYGELCRTGIRRNVQIQALLASTSNSVDPPQYPQIVSPADKPAERVRKRPNGPCYADPQERKIP